MMRRSSSSRLFATLANLFIAVGLLISLIPVVNARKDAHDAEDLSVRHTLLLRQASLRRFAEAKKPVFPEMPRLESSSMMQGGLLCPTDRFVVITEGAYGRAGNHLIEFTHGLWIAEQLNATLIIPNWMKDMFAPFHTATLDRLYCYAVEKKPPSGSKVFEVTSKEAFHPFWLYRQAQYVDALPAMNHSSTIPSLSKHFLQVYAALWCCPHKRLFVAAEHLISRHLDNNFQYSSVHKRQLEGGCSKVLATNTIPGDFSPAELPMYHDAWKGNLKRNHPLCDMTHSFVEETLALHKRNMSKLFVAYDGQGSVSDYQAAGAIFSSVLKDRKDVDFKYLDMFVAMHGDFFIMNPRSTFSLVVHIIRILLSLQTVPMIKNNDFYLFKVPDDLINCNPPRPLWVSSYSMIQSLLEE